MKWEFKAIPSLSEAVMLVATVICVVCTPALVMGVERSVALKEFRTIPGPIKFSGSSAYHDIYVPIYQKSLLKAITLDIEYMNSISLLPDISQLVVLADGFVIGQTSLAGSRQGGRVRYNIPVELLNGEIMRLSFKVNQHYETDCENPIAGQLWTDINPVKSRLTFTWNSTPDRQGIRGWVKSFSPSNPLLNRAAIVVPETGSTWLEAASNMAAWLASLRKYRPLELDVSLTPVKGIPNIIIGPDTFIRTTFERVTAAFRESSDNVTVINFPESVTGPMVATVAIPFPDDNFTNCLIVTGRDESQVLEASRLVAMVEQDWPENNRLLLKPGVATQPPPYRRNCMVPERDYTLEELGLYSNMSFEGMGVDEKSISVYIPPELFRQENRYAKLYLDIVYSAGLREDSSLHINVNDTLAGSIPLNNPDGRTFTNYLVNIPMSFFRGGHNSLSFKAVMKPFRSQKCAPVGQESMVTTILNTSVISIPSGFEHYTLPNLSVFLDDMFPYSLTLEKQKGITLVIPELDNMDIFKAAVNFAAMFAKQLATPFNYLEFTDRPDDNVPGDTIFIGTLDSLPDDFRKSLPIFPEAHRLKYFLPGKEETAIFISNSIRDSRMMITELEFPIGTGKTAVAFAAQRADIINRGMKIVAQSGASKIYGDTALVDTITRQIQSFSINRNYKIGRLGIQGSVGNWLTSRPEYYYPILVIIVLITAMGVLYLVRRRNRMRMESLDD